MLTFIYYQVRMTDYKFTLVSKYAKQHYKRGRKESRCTRKKKEYLSNQKENIYICLNLISPSSMGMHDWKLTVSKRLTIALWVHSTQVAQQLQWTHTKTCSICLNLPDTDSTPVATMPTDSKTCPVYRNNDTIMHRIYMLLLTGRFHRIHGNNREIPSNPRQ